MAGEVVERLYSSGAFSPVADRRTLLLNSPIENPDVFHPNCTPGFLHARTHIRREIILTAAIFRCEGDMEILDSIADKDPLANLKRLEDRNKLKVPGTRLLRVWKGRQHEVIVDTDGKFIYRGKRFRTLSAIARKITGVQWNGKQFFGVKS